MLKSVLTSLYLSYLRLCAHIQLLKNPSATIIGITGSSGKSSAKQAVAAILQDYYLIKVCDHGNSESGIPLDILGIEINDYSVKDWIRIAFLALWKLLTHWERYQVLIVEMGIDSIDPPKNMAYLLTIVKPHIGVFLSVSTVHAQNFDKALHGKFYPTPQAYEAAIKKVIAQEKGRLVTELAPSGWAILNGDEPLITQLKPEISAQIRTYGYNQSVDLHITNTTVSLQHGFQMLVQINNNMYELDLSNQVLGNAYAHTFAAALAVAGTLNISPEQAVRSLANNFQLPPSRLNLLAGKNHTYVIDSSYNASLQSTLDAIHLCSKLTAPRKIAILGDLREVGNTAEHSHLQVAQAAMQQFQEIIFVGPLFKQFTQSLLSSLPDGSSSADPQNGEIDSSSTADTLHFVPTAAHVFPLIKDKLTTGTLFLIKGSQNTIFLEYVVEQLLDDPADVSQLCRQSDYWRETKRKFFEQNL